MGKNICKYEYPNVKLMLSLYHNFIEMTIPAVYILAEASGTQLYSSNSGRS